MQWLEAIREGTCTAVTDGSYIRELYPDMCSCTFVLECTRGRGRVFGAFPEQSKRACACRGQLLGLMAIHLILLAVNKLEKQLPAPRLSEDLLRLFRCFGEGHIAACKSGA